MAHRRLTTSLCGPGCRGQIGSLYPLPFENKKKRLIQEQKEQERKDRTNRLCKRMGFIEKLLPDTIPLTEEQFKTFVEQTIATDHSPRTGRGNGGEG